MNISPRTAELALLALDAVLRRQYRNASLLPPDFVRALQELHAAAAVSPERQNSPCEHVAEQDLITCWEAARRLGVSTRTIERRAKAGQIPANRVGRTWQIAWNHEQMNGARQWHSANSSSSR